MSGQRHRGRILRAAPHTVCADTNVGVGLRYLAIAALANLVWETAQLPLYTIWRTGSPRELAFAVVHCSAGDVMALAASLVVALLVVRDRAWPARSYARVGALATLLGIAFTVFSEWFNVEVRKSWAYVPAMPVLPMLGTGLAPLLQWVVIPPAVLALVRPRKRWAAD